MFGLDTAIQLVGSWLGVAVIDEAADVQWVLADGFEGRAVAEGRRGLVLQTASGLLNPFAAAKAVIANDQEISLPGFVSDATA